MCGRESERGLERGGEKKTGWSRCKRVKNLQINKPAPVDALIPILDQVISTRSS